MHYIGLVNLPEHNMPQTGIATNLNGWWKAPIYVEAFWATACRIQFTDKEDFEVKKKQLLESYQESVSLFYKENVF